MASQTLLEFKNITKTFPGVVANDRVSLSIKEGDIHALLGENGAGKSTLMNVLYGLYQADEGEIYYRGEEIKVKKPDQAISLGIGMIHQSFMLVEAFSVFDNLILGLKNGDGPFIDRQKLKRSLTSFIEEMDIPLDLDAIISDLSVGMQQKVEIIKALYKGADLLILDEPTAVLTPQESHELFRMLKQLKKDGCTIIFISHKLKEVIEICDSITILRDGKHIETLPNKDLSVEALSQLMVGREISALDFSKSNKVGAEALRLDHIYYLNQHGKTVLNDINITVREGEIFGIAGVDGNGQQELAEVTGGTLLASEGKVFLQGRDVTAMDSRQLANAGLGYIPSDRRTEGLVMDFSIRENFIIREYHKEPFSRHHVLQQKEIEDNAEKLSELYNVKTPSIEIKTSSLSGGNQQKLVLAREMEADPRVLLVAQPTWGLDVGACEFVYEKLMKARDQGMAILLISTDLEEVRALSDRLAVIYEGRIMGVFEKDQASVAEIGMLMAGIDQKQEN